MVMKVAGGSWYEMEVQARETGWGILKRCLRPSLRQPSTLIQRPLKHNSPAMEAFADTSAHLIKYQKQAGNRSVENFDLKES